VALASLAACASQQAHRSAGGILSIDVPSESGNDLPTVRQAGSMVVGERFEIRLGASSGTGYQWMLAGPTPANMQMTSADPAGAVKPQDGVPRPGGATWTTFGMTAIAQGDAAMRFELVRPWENDGRAAPARVVEVAVTVKPRP
jgi:predicted secreted protein